MNYRSYFIGVESKVKLENGKTVVGINFDNGATTPPMKCTVDAIQRDLNWYGALGRSKGQKNAYCTEKFNSIRNNILNFFHLKSESDYTVVYVKSATEGLNLLAHVLLHGNNDMVLISRMEHHANLIPWRENSTRVDYIETDSMGRLPIQNIEAKLRYYRGKVKYVAITATSNVTGYVNDIHQIARLCHRYGAKIIVDGAQIVAHREVDLAGDSPEERIDFFAFSAHKAYAPFGGGAVIGLKEYLYKRDPFLKGGAAVDNVFDFSQKWLESPARMEAGTQNYFGVISMDAALRQLRKIGFEQIVAHENELKDYLLSNMSRIPNVILYGDTADTEDRIGVIVFNVKGKKHWEVGEALATNMGIATRDGKFCAHPYVTRLLGVVNLPQNEAEQDSCGMVRISLGLYNTKAEADRFLSFLKNL